MKSPCVGILGALLLAGCASVETIRQSEPTASGIFPGQWREFAECVNYDLGNRVLFDGQTETARVGRPTNIGIGDYPPDYELTIRQMGAATVQVDLRQRWTIAKDWARDQYWSAVERCGGLQASASSR